MTTEEQPSSWGSWLSTGLAQVSQAIRSTVEAEVATLRSEHSEAQRRDSASRLPVTSLPADLSASSSSSSSSVAATHATSSSGTPRRSLDFGETSDERSAPEQETSEQSIGEGEPTANSTPVTGIAASLARVKATLGIGEKPAGATQSTDADVSSSPAAHRLEALPPWLDFRDPRAAALPIEEQECMQLEILGLVKNKKNFLTNPPADAEFDFDYDGMLPVCLAALEADEPLRKIRFWLVPKYVKEPRFWRNYMYRISLIRAKHGVLTLSSYGSTVVSAEEQATTSAAQAAVKRVLQLGAERRAASEQDPQPEEEQSATGEVDLEEADSDPVLGKETVETDGENDELDLAALHAELGIDLELDTGSLDEVRLDELTLDEVHGDDDDGVLFLDQDESELSMMLSDGEIESMERMFLDS